MCYYLCNFTCLPMVVYWWVCFSEHSNQYFIIMIRHVCWFVSSVNCKVLHLIQWKLLHFITKQFFLIINLNKTCKVADNFRIPTLNLYVFQKNVIRTKIYIQCSSIVNNLCCMQNNKCATATILLLNNSSVKAGSTSTSQLQITPQVFIGQWPGKPSVSLFLVTIWQSIIFLAVKQWMIAISPRKSLQQPNTKAAFIQTAQCSNVTSTLINQIIVIIHRVNCSLILDITQHSIST